MTIAVLRLLLGGFFLLLCVSSALAGEPKRTIQRAKHAIVIGCDGFGGLYMQNATSFLPNIAAIVQRGSATFKARDQMPSVSAPNWATIITGLGPVESGIDDNDWTPPADNPPNTTVLELPPISGAGKIPETMWRAAKQQDSHVVTAVSISWDWINYLVESDTVDYLFRAHENDTAGAQAMAQFIQKAKPNLMFVHFDGVDEAGHSTFWGSDVYYQAARNVDAQIGVLVAALKQANIFEETFVVVTADHGGWRNEHGLYDQANVYIPALFAGPGVKAGKTITSYVSDRDFAPTVLHSLGLKPGQFMVGRVLDEIFE